MQQVPRSHIDRSAVRSTLEVLTDPAPDDFDLNPADWGTLTCLVTRSAGAWTGDAGRIGEKGLSDAACMTNPPG